MSHKTKPSKNSTPKETGETKGNKTPEKGGDSLHKNFKYDEVNTDNFDIGELKHEGGNQIAFVNYNETATKMKKTILLQTGGIKMVAGGTPLLDEELKKLGYTPKGHYPDDSKRKFTKLPFDPKQKSCMKLRGFMARMDEYFDTNEFRVKCFGAQKAANYMYSPCITPPFEEDDASKSKTTTGNKKPRYETCKMHYSTDRETHEVKTRFIRVEKGKGRTPVPIKTITDITKAVPFKSTVKVIFAISCILAYPIPKTKNFTYSLRFKIIKVHFTPGEGSSMDYDAASFDSDSDEEENEDENDDTIEAKPKKSSDKPGKNTDKPSTKPAPKLAKLDSQSDSGADDSVEEIQAKKTEKPSQQAKKKAQIKGSSDEASDDGNSDSEDNKKKGSKNSKKKPAGSDEDSDSNEIEIKKTSKTDKTDKSKKGSKNKNPSKNR